MYLSTLVSDCEREFKPSKFHQLSVESDLHVATVENTLSAIIFPVLLHQCRINEQAAICFMGSNLQNLIPRQSLLQLGCCCLQLRGLRHPVIGTHCNVRSWMWMWWKSSVTEGLDNRQNGRVSRKLLTTASTKGKVE